jgi:hypothetical protein
MGSEFGGDNRRRRKGWGPGAEQEQNSKWKTEASMRM